MDRKSWILFAIFVVLGIWTLIPAQASKPCLLGYYAHCTFTPISTLILFAIAGRIFWVGQKKAKK